MPASPTFIESLCDQLREQGRKERQEARRRASIADLPAPLRRIIGRPVTSLPAASMASAFVALSEILAHPERSHKRRAAVSVRRARWLNAAGKRHAARTALAQAAEARRLAYLRHHQREMVSHAMENDR